LLVIYSIIKLTLVLGSESSLLSTRMVVNNADILQFGDMFKVSVEQDRLCSCTVQLRVTDSQQQCWVVLSYVFATT